VEYLVKPDELEGQTLKLANGWRISLHPLSVSEDWCKCRSEGIHTQVLCLNSSVYLLLGTEDKDEAVSAFIEKRKPVFKDK
jgi:1,4-dihydroxy-2-naphthoyl-CoA synthase